MSPRAYRMGKRAELAEQTRLRIVEATMALHRERGVVATTMKDIAERADVGIGTVYHHFPAYEDAIRACGIQTVALTRPPSEAIFDGVRGWRSRVQILVTELFDYYDRQGPTWSKTRADADRFPVLAEMLARRDARIRALTREALRPLDPDKHTLATVVTLVDYGVHNSLRAAGLSTGRAADQITDVLTGWLSSQAHRRSRRGVHS